MAVDKLKRNSVIKGTITAASGFKIYENLCRQIGNLVWVKCYIEKNSGTIPNTGAATHIATISGVDLPSQNTRFTAGCGSAAYEANKSCYAITGSNGKIEVLPSVASAAVVINLCYMAGSDL